MGRLPFDPSRMANPPAGRSGGGASGPSGGTSGGDPVLTVSQVAMRIDGALRAGIPNAIRFSGEVSGFRDRTHWYFDLKDADAVVSCVMFASIAKRSAVQLRDGQQVVAKGRIEFYAKGGKVSVIIDSLEAAGDGGLDAQFKRLVEELRAIGYLDPARKRALPVFPRRVAVVTSRTGAALQDVLVTMKRRCPAVGVLIVDARVQGERASEDVASAIRLISRRHESLGVDALLVTRGGGSKEDLWAFNERVVAEAIVTCSVPVVAAIGHETDVTIAELVADERCATPTQAAMRLTPDMSELLRQVQSFRQRLVSAAKRSLSAARSDRSELARATPIAMRHALAVAASRLARSRASLEQQRPAAVHARLIARLAALDRAMQVAAGRIVHRPELAAARARLASAERTILKTHAAGLEARARQLRAVAPERVLERGYSYTTTADGRIVRSVSEVAQGQSVTTRVVDGQFDSVVGGGVNRLVAKPRRGGLPPSGPGLFG